MTKTKIALSSWVCKYPDDLVPIAVEAGFDAIEWDLNYIPLPLSIRRLVTLRRTLCDAGISVRFHLPYSTCDVGHKSADVRKASLQFLQLNIDLVAEMGGSNAVVHFAAIDAPVVPSEDELAQLIVYGNLRNVAISIENTISGITSQPSDLARLAKRTGCRVALDTGHARYVAKDRSTFETFVEEISDFINHVHFYGSEDHSKNHLPFVNEASAVETATTILRHSQIDWWTCEMDILENCRELRSHLLPILQSNQ